MKTKAFLTGLLLAATATTAQAGGILTNTNQSIDFLRNPARDAAIGLDGVYSNPAGVAFLPDGFHLGINWQYAHQTRTITTTSPYLGLGFKNNNQNTKVYEGVADAPFIPSLQAAWNKNNWSLQFNFSVTGGGGACEYADGLGSFESKVGLIASKFMTIDGFANSLNQFSSLYPMMGMATPEALPTYGVSGYDMDGYMQGRQYYFGFQLGSAYKVNDNLSVYGGLRILYGTATYKAKISNIMVNTEGGLVSFASFLPNVPAQATAVAGRAQEVLSLINAAQAAGAQLPQQVTAAVPQLQAGLASLQDPESQKQLADLSKYSQGVNLLCNQWSVGVAPVVGIDYKYGNFNFAAKYEFETEIHMKNESTVNSANEIDAVKKFRDGEEVREDQPALLAVGAQWSPLSMIRLNAGWHHYFDKSAQWFENAQEKLSHDTNEFLLGAEWDVNPRVTISLGGQLTRYGLTDEYMNDMSFVVNSYSIGFGGNFKVNDKVILKGGFFQTNYENYDRKDYPETGSSDIFTRTNYVLGLGCEITL